MTRIVAVQGDLTAQNVDAVVNAANEHLAHGGGVAAAIVRAGGRVVQDESDRWIAEHGPVPPGGAAVTSAGAMPARWVIHVVGPRYRAGQDNAGMLAAAVTAGLNAATEVGARSLAMPAISAGIFGYPPEEATALIAHTISAWCAAHPDVLNEVRLVGYDAATRDLFQAGLDPA